MVRIISDSTCDLSRELLERYEVEILPLHVILGERDCLDGVDVTPAELFAWSDEHKTTPKTSACSVDEAIRMFAPHMERGDEVICFTVSAQMSSAYQNVCLAAEEMGAADRIWVIDSRNLSTGIGLQVLRAAELAQQGKGAQEILQEVLKIRNRVRASFVVDTLTYLHRGGRCSGLAAAAGNALHLHPRIEVHEGAMSAGRKYRGHMDRVLSKYAREMESELRRAEKKRVFLTHAGAAEATVAELRSYLESLEYFEEILETTAGSVISSHCGPGTLGVLYIAGETL